MKRRICSIVTAASLLLSCIPSVHAEDSAAEELEKSIILLVDSNSCFVDGKLQSVGDSAPVIVESRTLVPARFLAESLGGTASWDPDSETATLTLGKDTIEIPIGQNSIIVNDDEQALDVGGSIINDRTMMPLRGICEAMGKNVAYDDGMIIIGEYDFNQRTNIPEAALARYSLRNSMMAAKNSATIGTGRSLEAISKSAVRINGTEHKLPYTSPINTLLFSVGGMHVENLSITAVNEGDCRVQFDVYNQSYTYGAVESYDHEGKLKEVRKVDSYHGGVGQSTNPIKYFTSVRDYGVGIANALYYQDGSYMTYRNGESSKKSHIDITVPEGGYLVVCINPNDSYYVSMYNTVHLLVELYSALSDIQLTDKLTGSLDTSKLYEKAFTNLFTENKKLGGEIAAEIGRILCSKEFTPWNSYSVMKEIASEIMSAIDKLNIDVAQLIEETAGDALADAAHETFLSVVTALGFSSIEFAFKAGQTFFDLSNLVCFCMDYIYNFEMQTLLYDFSGYRYAYKQFLTEYAKDGNDYARFGLIYVDDDDIPELVISEGPFHIAMVRLYTYADFEVKEVMWDGSNFYGDYGVTNYKERGGLITANHFINGIGSISNIISVDGPEATRLHTFTTTFVEDDAEYTVDDVPTAYEQFEQMWSAETEGFLTFDNSDGKELTEENMFAELFKREE